MFRLNSNIICKLFTIVSSQSLWTITDFGESRKTRSEKSVLLLCSLTAMIKFCVASSIICFAILTLSPLVSQMATFLLVFVVIAGACLGFWVVRKLVRTEEGSVDVDVAYFVAWSIRIVASLMILQVLVL